MVSVIALCAGGALYVGGATFTQLLLGGVLVGGLYTVTALGLALMLGVMKILNFAHGEFLILAAYMTFWLSRLMGVDPFITLAVTCPTLFLFGMLCYRVTLSRTVRKGFDQPVVVTFGLMLFLQNVYTLLWTGNTRAVLTSYSTNTFIVGGVTITILRLVVFILSIAAVLIFHIFLSKAYFGKLIRATMQDYEVAELQGVNTSRVYLLAFGIGSALCGFAGTLISLMYAFEPSVGPLYLLKSLTVVVLAGMGSFLPLALTGVIIGIAESFGSFLVGGGFRDAIPFVLFLLTLLLKPKGLFGRY